MSRTFVLAVVGLLASQSLDEVLSVKLCLRRMDNGNQMNPSAEGEGEAPQPMVVQRIDEMPNLTTRDELDDQQAIFNSQQ